MDYDRSKLRYGALLVATLCILPGCNENGENPFQSADENTGITSEQATGTEDSVLEEPNTNVPNTPTAPPSDTSIPISIQSPPKDTFGYPGQSVTFSIAASSELELSYQWFHDGAPIPDATSPTLSVMVTENAAGSYRVEISNDTKTEQASARLDVGVLPAITQQPNDAAILAGGGAVFSVSAEGTSLQYRWERNSGNGWQPISGATSEKLTIENASAAGNVQYRVKAYNEGGQALSQVVNLVVERPAVITAQPTNQTKKTGTSLALQLSATGDGLNYEWLKDGQSLGTGSPSLTLSGLKLSDAGTYSCKVWNQTTSASCKPFTLSMQQDTQVTQQPGNASGFEGQSITLTANAVGKPAPTINWYRDGKLIKADSEKLTLSNLSKADAGTYQCIAANSLNADKCKPSTVTVKEKVRIIDHPTNQMVAAGDTIQLNVSATGALPLRYRCFRDSELVIDTQNPAALTIPDSAKEDEGKYYCQVSNEGTKANTSSAAISVMTDNTRDIVVSWTPPTQRQDGSKLPANEIRRFIVEIAPTIDGPFEVVARADGDASKTVIKDLSMGEFYFIGVTTRDTNGLKGPMSKIFRIQVPE